MSIRVFQRRLLRKHLLTSLFPCSEIKENWAHAHAKLRLEMNEAHVRHDQGNETFDFTFRYVNPDLNIDKQCNFSRKTSETVNSFLKRIDANVGKYVKKKQSRKQKKGTKSSPEVENVEDNVENDRIMLLRDDSKISGDTICETFLRANTLITFRILGSDYVIKYNSPWISNLALPKSILAGFPVYPVKMEASYTRREDSLFSWFRGKKSVPPTSADYWEKVGEGFIYSPENSEIGCKLKVSCEPRNGEQRGPIVEVESTNCIEAGPGHCPFETRHQFTRKLSGKSFRVMSYNILADTYADSDYSRETLFPYIPAYALEIDYRKQLIVKEIIGFNADIACLQEVDTKVYEHDLFPSLSTVGFHGHYTKKGSQLSEGLATFFDEKRFEMVHSEFRVMSQDVEMGKFAEAWSRIENQASKDRFLGRNTTVQVTVLKSRENPKELLVIGNTHLYFHPNADYLRLLQGYYALIYVEQIMNETKATNPNSFVSVLLCGDFNSVPDCGIYQLLTQKHVPENYKDWNSHPEEKVENVSLSHDLSMASACGTPSYTNYTVEFNGCLDYIFYQTNRLKVAQVIPMPSDEDVKLHVAIPSVVFPSDHIPICADLQWTL